MPFVEVTTAERPLTVGGVEGRAVDLRVLDLPPEASRRGSFIGVPSCAHTIVMPGVGAREGQIVFSEALAGELSTAPGATTLDGVELKGVRAPMTLYRLETPTSAVPASSPDAS